MGSRRTKHRLNQPGGAAQRTLRVALAFIVVAVSFVNPASAQARRVAAVFGDVALVDTLAGDSNQGGMLTYGGELVVAIGGPFRAGIDVGVGRISRTDVTQTCADRQCQFVRTPFSFRQTALTFSAFGEWPRRARVRGFAGGGVGWLYQRLQGVHGWNMTAWNSSHSPLVLHARGGMVGSVSRHVCIRAEGVFSVGNGMSGILGARLGIGYLF